MAELNKGEAMKMIRFVNLDKLIHFVTNTKSQTIDLNDIMRFPVEDIICVKDGKWEYEELYGAFRCSNCQGLMIRNIYDFCPWCGAKMETVSKEIKE